MPAGRVLVVVVVALLVAALLNSEAIVRAGEGMGNGPTRDAVLWLGRPLDDAAGAVGLHLPREGLDLAFGQEPKTQAGTELERGSTAILRRRAPTRRGTTASPPAADPLHVLVTGDSQAEFVGQRMLDAAPDGLLRVDVVARNGTGLTRPEFFNWEVNAKQEIADRRPDAVVMVMGGNDGFNVTVDGSSYGPFTPEWETEYARRTAVVMRELGSRGRRPVYWAPSAHGARRRVQPHLPRAELRGGPGAPQAVPGARYVDLYDTAINGGRYRNVTKIDGREVVSRQPDGVHFTRDGALAPARLVVEGDGPGLSGAGDALAREAALSSRTGRPASWPGASTRRPFAGAPRTRCRPR